MASGGKRPGSGRKPKSKNKTTLERDAVLKEFRQRVMRKVDLLQDSQFSLARGLQYLYKIEKKKIVGPRGGVSYQAQKPVLVTDPEEIRMYIEGELEEGDADDINDPAATYYFITTKDPDNKAIDSLLDRTFGKSVNTIAGPDGGPLEVTVIKYAQKKPPTKK